MSKKNKSNISSFQRGVKIGFALCQGNTITKERIKETYDVSIAQAKRDLVDIEIALPVTIKVNPKRMYLSILP
jgi:hypothetical protein